MTFVRTATCPIRCRYCDTENAFTAPATVEVAGRVARNPVSSELAAELALACTPGSPAGEAVSITGGEPLVHAPFVRELGGALRALGMAVHLETAALDPEALEEAVEAVDHVSADYKLAGTLEEGNFAAAHVACVEIALQAGRSVDVKLVVTPEVDRAAFEAALEDLRAVRERVLLVLQPVTPARRVAGRPAPEVLVAFAAAARGRGFDVRVLPQLHPILGVR